MHTITYFVEIFQAANNRIMNNGGLIVAYFQA